MKKNYLLLLILSCILLKTSLTAQVMKLETALQKGHSEAVKTIQYSPDGKYLASAGRDKSIILWQLATGRQIRSFLGHSSTINTIAFSPDGTKLVSGGSDNIAIVWEVNTGEVIHKFTDHIERITSVQFSPDGSLIASGGYDDSVLVWQSQNGKVVQKIAANSDKGLGYGVSVSFSPDGKSIAVGNDNKTTEVWNLATGAKIKSLRYEPDGWSGGSANKSILLESALYMASNHAGIYQWNTTTWKPELIYQEKITECKSFSQQKDYLMACMEDEIKVWNIKNATLIYTFKNDSLNYNTAMLHPDGNSFAIAGDSKVIAIYSMSTGKIIQTLKGVFNEANNDGLNYDFNSRWDYYIANYLATKTNIALSPDGKYIAKGKVGADAILIDLSTGRIARELKGHQKVVIGLQFSADGKYLLTASGDKTAKLWEVASGKVIQTYKGHSEVVFEAKFSHDGKNIITASWDATIKYWDLATGKILNTIEVENGSAYSLALTTNDAYILSAGLDKKLRLIEIDSKLEAKNFVGHTDVVQTVAMSPDGKTFLSAGWDGRARLWDIASGLQLFKISAHTDKVCAAAFDHLGEWMATGSADRTIKIWEANTGKEVTTLQGHTSAVSCIAFTYDKKFLISTSIDGIIKIWDLKTFKEKATYITIGTKDWIVKTPEGYFDATDPVKDFIFFIRGKESFSIDQFFDEFYKPKLLKKLLTQQGTEDLMDNVVEKIDKFPPPVVEFKTAGTNEKFSAAAQTIQLKIVDNGGGIDEVKFTHNGKRIPNLKSGMERGAKRGNVINMFFSISLQPGANEIVVSAYSKGRIESKKYTKNFYLQSEEKKATCHLFTVGINQYKNPSMTLNYALADAKDFAETIASKGNHLFSEVKLYQIYDEQATRKNILDQLVAIAAVAKPEDVFIFYYAGHGSMLNDKFYFIPTDITRLYEEETLQREAIYAGEMQEILQNIKALKQVMVIDACHSGASAEMLAMRGGGEEKAIAQLSRSAGVHILASAGSEQTAGEFKTLGHGIFTYALLNALKGEADGSPKDGKVTVYELKSYLDDKVPELTNLYKNTTQYPHTFSKGNDFPLVLE